VRSPRGFSERTLIVGAAAALCLVAIACGHRGDPRPPVYPAPPPIIRLTVSQVGTDAVLRFPLPPAAIEAGNDSIEVDTIEVLVYAERYPVLDLELLATALERHRDLIIEDAILAAEAAAEAERLEAIREQYEDPAEGAAAVAAAQAEAAEAAEARAEEEEEEEEQGPRDPDQRLIYHVSPTVRDLWREQGVTADVILDTARNLEAAASTVWTRTGLPTTVLDPSMPMSLPDPAELVELAEVLLAATSYEREIPVETFVTRAGAPQQMSYEDAEERVVEELVQVAHPMGIPSPEEIRTRYFFSARPRSERNVEGEVRTVRSLAPSPVPLSPTHVTTELGLEPRLIPIPLVLPVLIPGVDESQPPGVNVSWDHSPGDVWGRLLLSSSLVYNVYRIKITEETGEEPVADPPEEPAEPIQEELPAATTDEASSGPREELSATPLNARPLTGTAFIDRDMEWGEVYAYEVRAMVAPPLSTGRRESAGARSEPIEAIDTFPPEAPMNLQVVRAGSQVRLQWSAATETDLRGYRVYRHSLPAPLELDDTWDALTTEPVGSTRFLDSTTESGVRYAYAVISVDNMGNTSEPLIAEEPGAFEE
jgi:hypothetical protein